MDTHGHEKIAKVGEDLLNDAFAQLFREIGRPPVQGVVPHWELLLTGDPRGKLESTDQKHFRAKHPKNVRAFHLGNWLTDLEQLVDDVAYASVAGPVERIADEAVKVLDEALSKLLVEYEGAFGNVEWWSKRTVPAGSKDASAVQKIVEALRQQVRSAHKTIQGAIDTLFGEEGGEYGQIAEALRNLVRVLAYLKFAHPRDKRFRFESFKNILDQFLDPNKSKHGFRGSYYPHHHLDRWPVKDSHYAQPDNTRNTSRSEEHTPGIYPYMRDHIEYAAGILADLDMNWARPTFNEHTFNGEPLPGSRGAEDVEWSDEQWQAWEREQDERMAMLGHAVHICEDFFAHSTFVEHALRLWINPNNSTLMDYFLKWTESKLGVEIPEGVKKTLRFVKGIDDGIPKLVDPRNSANPWRIARSDTDRDFTRYTRRFLKLDIGRYTAGDEDWLRSEGAGEDENVVTGYFDFHDTAVAAEHFVMTMFGYAAIEGAINLPLNIGYYGTWYKTKKKPPIKPKMRITDIYTGRADRAHDETHYIRKAFDALSNPLWAIKNYASDFSEDTKKYLESIAEDYDQMAEGASKEIDELIVRKVAGESMPDGTPEEVIEWLVSAMTRLGAVSKMGGHVWNFYKAIRLLVKLFTKPQLLALELLVNESLSHLLSKNVKILEDKATEWMGSTRIGSHSLLAKDHEDDFCNDKAIHCAKAVDWCVIGELLRWQQLPRDADCSIKPFSGATGGGSQGENRFNTKYWIDWTELLEFFLRHPGGTRSTTEEVIVYVSKPHVTVDGDQLGNLCKKYGYDKGASDPKFDWRAIARHNYGTDVPREINAILRQRGEGELISDGVNMAWKPGTMIWVPDQPLKLPVINMNKDDFEVVWYRHVMEKGWDVIKKLWDVKRHGRAPGLEFINPKPPVANVIRFRPTTVKIRRVEEIKKIGEQRSRDWISAYSSAARGQRKKKGRKLPPVSGSPVPM